MANMPGFKILIKGINDEELAQVKQLCEKRGWPFSVAPAVLRKRPRSPVRAVTKRQYDKLMKQALK